MEGEAAQKEFLKEISSLIDSARDDMGLLLDVALFFDHANIFFVNQRAVAHGAFIASHSIGFLMTDFRPVKDANRPVEVAILLEKP